MIQFRRLISQRELQKPAQEENLEQQHAQRLHGLLLEFADRLFFGEQKIY